MQSSYKHDSSISISNEIIRSAQGLNLWEKRVLMLAVSKIDSKAAVTLGAGEVTLRVTDLVSLYSVNKDSAYQEAKKAAEGIMKRQIRLKPNDAETNLIQWVIESTYKPREGLINVEVHPKLIPHLQALKAHFTSYKLSRVSGLQSVYSWRLFELLMQFKRTGLLNIPIDDFYHAMDAPESLRANFSNLRNRVIEPAVKEIREKDGLAVEWEAIKAGRKVKALKFTFPNEQQLSLDTHPKATNSADTPRTGQQAEQGAKAKKSAKQEIEAFLSLSETKSRLQSARELANLVNAPVETYLTEKDRASIAHYELTI